VRLWRASSKRDRSFNTPLSTKKHNPHTLRIVVPLIALCSLISGCAHKPITQEPPFTPPSQVVSHGVAGLVDQQAELSAFDRYRESSVGPVKLRKFESVARITADYEFAATDIAEHREWFRSSLSVWHYTFECQYSGILFVDKTGRVRHAILLG
jgi:hypothetical protein